MNLAVIGLIILVMSIFLFGGKVYEHINSYSNRLKRKV